MQAVKVFIVGCPRSGTTLLQSMLAAHPYIMSLPETHFFFKLFYGNYRLQNFGITIWSKKIIENFEQIGSVEKKPIGIKKYFVGHLTKTFFEILDSKVKENGKKILVEKTPIHLRYIPWIEKYLVNSKQI